MTGTEVNTSSAWAERTLAVLLLPFAFLVMVGGGAGLIWLWQDYRSQFWIGVCAVAVLALLASSGTSVAGRQRRRMTWLSGREGAPDFDQPGIARSMAGSSAGPAASSGDSHALLLELLSRVDALQQDLDQIMGEFSSEQDRANGGRHSGTGTGTGTGTGRRSRAAVSQQIDDLPVKPGPPLMVDIRDDAEDLGFGSDDEDDDEDLDQAYDDFEDFEDDVADGQADDDYPEILRDEFEEPAPAGSVTESHLDVASTDATAGRAEQTEPVAAEAIAPEAAGLDHESIRAALAGLADAAELAEPASDAGSGDEPYRRMRRLVRDRSSRQQWDSIPAQREPVSSIDLTSEPVTGADISSIQAGLQAGLANILRPPFPPGNHGIVTGTSGAPPDDSGAGAASVPGSDAGHEDEDDSEYFGDDLTSYRDEYRSSFLGEDDDEHPQDAR